MAVLNQPDPSASKFVADGSGYLFWSLPESWSLLCSTHTWTNYISPDLVNPCHCQIHSSWLHISRFTFVILLCIVYLHFPSRLVSWSFSSPSILDSLFNFRIELRRKCATEKICLVKPANQRLFFEEISSWCSARRYRLWWCHECSGSRLAKEMTHDLEMNFNKIAPSIWQRSWLRSC